MANETQCLDASKVILDSSRRLQELDFGPEIIQPLLDACAVIALRQTLGPNRPPLIGFIGCTGTGKSTLFNSLIGKALSSTSWHAHNTSGPVLAADIAFQKAIEAANILLLPAFSHQRKKENQPVTGCPNELHLFYLSANLNAVYIDLPDINTTRARHDQQISLQIMPWLDTAVFITDDETVYHRDYQEPVQLSEELQQNRVCVLVNRGRDQVDLDHRDLQSVREFFSVHKITILPNLDGKLQYTNEPDFIQLHNQLKQTPPRKNHTPLLCKIADDSADLMKKNQSRFESLEQTGIHVQKTLDTCLSKPVKIPLDTILQDEVLHVLHHLGLRRFAVSNVLHFLRSMVSTGSIKRSFQLAFGKQRGTLLETMLQFDEDKLVTEAAKRLSDFGEEIDGAIRRSPHSAALFKIAPEFRNLSAPLINIEDQEQLQESLKQALRGFEDQCKSLLQSDTIKSSVKNDPLVAVSVVVTLIADIMTIPGTGSFLLVPSAFSFLPLGKFEKAKKTFQQTVRDIIHTQVLQVKDEFNKQKFHFTLDPSEPVWKALTTCTAFQEKTSKEKTNANRPIA